MALAIGVTRAETNGLALVLVAAFLFHGTAAQQSGCTTTLMGLTSCLNYVSGNSSAPSSTCCSSLAGVVQSQPLCLCALLNGGTSYAGYTINQTLALGLPGACKVQTPPLSRCNVAPSPAPTTAPTDDTPVTSSSPNAVPSGSGAVGGGGSKATPSPTAEGSGSSARAPLQVAVLLILLVASYASIAKNH